MFDVGTSVKLIREIVVLSSENHHESLQLPHNDDGIGTSYFRACARGYANASEPANFVQFLTDFAKAYAGLTKLG